MFRRPCIGMFRRDSRFSRGFIRHILIDKESNNLRIACAGCFHCCGIQCSSTIVPAMGEVHQLILQYGIEEARRQAVTKHERIVIEAAYQVLSDDAEKMGFTYSGFALTSLHHKPQPELTWKRDGHNLTMLVQSGVDRAGKPLGLPYGSYARFILLFLQSEAIRTGSREIELGRSMRVWLGSMGLSIGGMTYKKVNEQARRISGCSLTFFADRDGAQIKSRGGFVKTEITMTDVLNEHQPALWQDRVVL